MTTARSRTEAVGVLPRPKLWTPRIVLVLVAQFTFGLSWSMHLIQPKFLASALKADPNAIARVTMMSPLASVLVLPLAILLMDRVNRVWLFRLGLLLLITASVAYSFVDHLSPVLFLLQALVGPSYAFAYNSSAAIIADEAPRERLGEAVGLLGASNVVTNAIATTIAEHVANAAGWPAAFRTSTAFAVGALVLSLVVKDHRRSARPVEHVPLGPVWSGPLGRVLLCSMLTGAAFSAMFTFHQPYVLKLGGKSVSPFFVGFTSTAVAVRLLFGSLGDRVGHRRISMLAMIAYGAVTFATASLHVQFLIVYGLAFGAAHGVLYPTLNTFALHVSPEGTRGRVIALYSGAFSVGTSVALLGWGKLATAAGFPAVFIAASVVAWVGALLLTERRPRTA